MTNAYYRSMPVHDRLTARAMDAKLALDAWHDYVPHKVKKDYRVEDSDTVVRHSAAHDMIGGNRSSSGLRI